ncbi:hypothetical protein [Mycobacteroides abscessus]|uniref:hypothetical protein n=1 Tax=Mycobacteroides abscessus TaxID=36809 RepID=UPI0009A628E7|nr:hypothetical protein [Mycobacteroides abscessus]MBN7458477.1 hypothetical protein [Mycobacteroides abscessus subsp. abscessus]SLC71435.1 Uncharacterised protein [Mycobacteroides abscessus subsp. massiliense]SLJ49060.1 Uncharacterised protein [Mycobacteroides abscessus subsp. abscessus]
MKLGIEHLSPARPSIATLAGLAGLWLLSVFGLSALTSYVWGQPNSATALRLVLAAVAAFVGVPFCLVTSIALANAIKVLRNGRTLREVLAARRARRERWSEAVDQLRALVELQDVLQIVDQGSLVDSEVSLDTGEFSSRLQRAVVSYNEHRRAPKTEEVVEQFVALIDEAWQAYNDSMAVGLDGRTAAECDGEQPPKR